MEHRLERILRGTPRVLHHRAQEGQMVHHPPDDADKNGRDRREQDAQPPFRRAFATEKVGRDRRPIDAEGNEPHGHDEHGVRLRERQGDDANDEQHPRTDALAARNSRAQNRHEQCRYKRQQAVGRRVREQRAPGEQHPGEGREHRRADGAPAHDVATPLKDDAHEREHARRQSQRHEHEVRGIFRKRNGDVEQAHHEGRDVVPGRRVEAAAGKRVDRRVGRARIKRRAERRPVPRLDEATNRA